MSDARLTAKEQQLHDRASTGPVAVFGIDFRTARRLENKAAGRTVSNPGVTYRGTLAAGADGRGGYYVQAGWTFNQTTKSYEKNPESV